MCRDAPFCLPDSPLFKSSFSEFLTFSLFFYLGMSRAALAPSRRKTTTNPPRRKRRQNPPGKNPPTRNAGNAPRAARARRGGSGRRRDRARAVPLPPRTRIRTRAAHSSRQADKGEGRKGISGGGNPNYSTGKNAWYFFLTSSMYYLRYFSKKLC
jgi:hypothetical protein